LSERGRRIKAARPVALVTGAARRVGKAIALELARSGFDLIVHYRNSGKEAEATAAEAERLGARAWPVRADLSRVDAIEGLVGSVTELCGRLDLLVNSASSFYATPFGSTREAQFDELIGSNLKAPFFCAQLAAPLLEASGRGQIVNLLDAAALRPFPAYLPYSAAKAGLLALTTGLARALAPRVRVNGVAPGAIAWPEDGQFEPGERERILATTPLARTGTPEDVAQAVHFLACAPYVTGQIVAVDGGRSIFL
jgi:pteridine reductase